MRGNAAERAQVRALADAVEADTVDLRDYLTRGCSLLAAFGLVAIGEVRRSARLALLAGGDADLSGLTTIDRALGFELLVAAAAEEGDADAAASWAARAEPLLDDPIAVSTLARIKARLGLLRGAVDEAGDWADRAVEHARAEGRAVEAAEAELLAARARRAGARSGSGAARLSAMAGEAERTGHRAARQAAVRELRASGRRLPPAPGSGWDGLSPRERDVALMIAEGLTNAEIAGELHLSEHTVRVHVSRTLAAFGAASRFVVAARIAELFPEEQGAPPPPLTPRQLAVARCIARGAGNAEIGRELGLSAKTVEKHVAEIQRRWSVGSRIAIVRLAHRLPELAAE